MPQHFISVQFSALKPAPLLPDFRSAQRKTVGVYGFLKNQLKMIPTPTKLTREHSVTAQHAPLRC